MNHECNGQSSDQRISLVANLMDQHLIKQNKLLIDENYDLSRDILENENMIMSLRQERDINESYTDQLIAENAVLMDQINRMRLDHTELMHDFNRQVERNIRLERQVQRLLSGDALFFHSSDSSDHTDDEREVEHIRSVRRRLQFEDL